MARSKPKPAADNAAVEEKKSAQVQKPSDDESDEESVEDSSEDESSDGSSQGAKGFAGLNDSSSDDDSDDSSNSDDSDDSDDSNDNDTPVKRPTASQHSSSSSSLEKGVEKAKPDRIAEPTAVATAKPKAAAGKGQKNQTPVDDDDNSFWRELESKAAGKAKAKAKTKSKQPATASVPTEADVGKSKSEVETAGINIEEKENQGEKEKSEEKNEKSQVETNIAQKEEKKEEAKEEKEAGGEEEAKGEEEESKAGEGKVLSKTQKAKLRRQQKKTVAAAEDVDDGGSAVPKGKSAPKAKSAAARLVQERIRLVREEEERQRKELEEQENQERERLRIIEEKKKEEEEKRQKRLEAKKAKKEKLRNEGKAVTSAQKKQLQINQAKIEQLRAAGMLPTDHDSQDVSHKDQRKKKKPRRKEEKEEDIAPPKLADPVPAVEAAQSEVVSDWEALAEEVEEPPCEAAVETPQLSKGYKKHGGVAKDKTPHFHETRLRSPICCILGHVDTGKTKLLDKIRHTKVQLDEAGGITQQIGATFFPQEALREQCKKVNPDMAMDVPGLLVIDTPGHESFNNLRARGSSLCDIAILVVDVMHGLEPQTRESLGLLRARKCPFVIALNKIDRFYGWTPVAWAATRTSLAKQPQHTCEQFNTQLERTLLQMQEEGMNCALYWDNSDVRRNVSVIPTSAITGEGIPDLLTNLVMLTQDVMSSALVHQDSLRCTILEVKNIEGLGTTIDVVLVAGTLHEGDRIVVCGMSGPIITSIRALLTPQPLKELRVKGEYVHHKTIHAAMGVKISAPSLEEAVAGTELFVVGPDDDEDHLKEEVMADMASIFKSVDRTGKGVYVMASTLGSLEALLQYLKDSKVEVFGVNIGTVHKLDIKKAAVMREKGHPELAVILAFDVKVEPDAEREAKLLGVKIMTANIIYHLFDEFTKYRQELVEEKKKEKAAVAVFPCVISIVPDCVFHAKDPIILGVKVEEGTLRMGTPICVPDKENLMIGKVTSIENNKKSVDQARKGDEVAIRLTGDSSIAVGRHFEVSNKICSRLTRDSIDCLKELFRDDLSKDDWRLVVKLKKLLGIPSA